MQCRPCVRVFPCLAGTRVGGGPPGPGLSARAAWRGGVGLVWSTGREGVVLCIWVAARGLREGWKADRAVGSDSIWDFGSRSSSVVVGWPAAILRIRPPFSQPLFPWSPSKSGKTRVPFGRTDLSIGGIGTTFHALLHSHGPVGSSFQGMPETFNFHDFLPFF